MKLDKVGKALIDKLKQDVRDFSIEFKPDQKNDREVYLLTGSQNELKSQISLLMAIRQLLSTKDIGTFIGEPYEPWIIQNAAPLTIQIHFRLTKAPPWEPLTLFNEPKLLGRSSLPRPYITIPNVSRTKAADWSAIKQACGGVNGYMWGPHYAVARLVAKDGEKLGKGGAMKMYGASASEALQRLEALLSFSQYTSFTTTTGEERQDKGQRAKDAAMKKPDIRVYPAWYYIHNRKLVEKVNSAIATQGVAQGRATAAGRKLKKQGQIPLWYDQPPTWLSQTIEDLLTFA